MKKRIIAIALVLMLVCLMTGCANSVPRPEIKSGEFNFSVTYEHLGEIHTISGVFVCNYAGTSWTVEGGDFSRDWVGYVEGVEAGPAYDVLISTTGDGGNIYIALGLSPDYFMGETYMLDFYTPAPYVFIEYSNEADDMAESFGDEELIAEIYGIRIISYQYDDPIENSFGYFNI